MKKQISIFVALLFMAAAFAANSFAQLAEEHRPFDFSDKYYYSNGIDASALTNRRDGADGMSVFDFTEDPKYSAVRIIATYPAYDANGNAIYWNHYADFSKDAFVPVSRAVTVKSIADTFAIYLFPSIYVRGQFRQAAMINAGAEYYAKDLLGISKVLYVEFTGPAHTREGQQMVIAMSKRNGISADGTPIIRTHDDLFKLIKAGLVTLRSPSNWEGTPYAVAKAIQFPAAGGITPDAYLIPTKSADGKPLESEIHFSITFDCLKVGSRECM